MEKEPALRTNAWMTVVVMVVAATAVQADLIQAFDGFESIQQVGTSELESSYHFDTKLGLPITGPPTGTMRPVFGPNPVVYPSPVGPVPSPGGAIGQNVDQGFLGSVAGLAAQRRSA